MKILFILALIALAVFAVSSIIKERKYTKIIRLVSCSLAVVLSLISAIAAPYLRSLGIGVAVLTAASFGLSIFAQQFKTDAVKSFVKYTANAILVILLLEAVCFNFNSYHLWKGGYDETPLDMSTATLTNVKQNGNSFVTNGESATIEFPKLDQKIGTIQLELKGTSYKTDYSIDFADETNASYYMRSGLVKGSVFNDIKQTKYVVCDFSGKVSKLKINLTELKNNTVTISGITLNADYPSRFSYLRFALILLSVMFVWAFKRSVNFRKPLSAQFKNAKAVTAVIVIVMVALSLLLSSVGLNPKKDFNDPTGNQITKELVDAFESGQVELKDKPGTDLLNMENPYDWSARTEKGVNAKWDHVLYDGKYYSYYGVGPVILLYLPYHLITGHYLASLPGVLLFNTLALIFLGMTFYQLMKRLFKDIPLSMFTAALIMIYASCGVWYCTVMANFYEIAQSSGFCFTVLGAYFLVTSNVIGGDKEPIRPLHAALSSLFLAIAVTCRPTTAIWCVVAVVFIIAGVMKLRRGKSERSAYVKYLCAALIPFVVIGGAQMIYNHARFGSFTDFGIAYSLTINDFTHTEFHTQLSAIGFFDYLFAPPSFTGEFPYVQSTLSTLGVNGYYFEATNNGAGLFYRALPMFFLFGAPFALKYVDKEKRTRTAILFSTVAFVAPFVIIASIWESGYGTRYMMDFAWEMLTCAFLVMFLFYRNLKGKDAKRIYEHLLLIAMFACLFINMGLVFAYWYPGSYVAGHEAMFERFGRMFSMFNT
ncbi:hypothetical protein [Ruminococcus sp.]|uniref:hypothetical protein n=1 Tax=Ruminococcus sp. TaxID=41978 RepID=UPI002E81C7CE|nr:hypothetical protein [Ruminococcus sp.]MEE3491821.1 hypothetical protein [Ruminococcus sp.]